MCVQPVLCPFDDLEELFRLRGTLQFRLAFSLADPKDGVVGVGIDGLVVQTLLPTEGKGVNNRQKLSDVVRAVHGTIVKHAITRLQIDGLIFHWARIARACCINSPSVSPYFQRQWKYGVMTICRGIYKLCHQLLHALRHLDAQQTHAILDNLGDVLCQHQAHGLDVLVGLVEDGVIVIELVENFRQFIAVVGDATR